MGFPSRMLIRGCHRGSARWRRGRSEIVPRGLPDGDASSAGKSAGLPGGKGLVGGPAGAAICCVVLRRRTAGAALSWVVLTRRTAPAVSWLEVSWVVSSVEVSAKSPAIPMPMSGSSSASFCWNVFQSICTGDLERLSGTVFLAPAMCLMSMLSP